MLGIVELTQMAQSFSGLDFLAIFGGIGWQEVLIVVVVVLVLFGGRKIPELARGIGRGMREFKREMRGVKEDLDEAMKEDEEEPRPRRKKKRKRPVEADDEAEEASEAEDSEESK